MDTKGIAIGLGVFMVGGLLAIALPIHKSRSLAEQNAWGKPFTAEVVQKRSFTTSSGSGSNRSSTWQYRLNYTYVLDGKRYCHHKVFPDVETAPPDACKGGDGAEINETTYDAYFVGDPVAIRLNPDKPAESYPVMLPDNGDLYIWGGFLALSGALVIWSSWHRRSGGEPG